MNVSDKLVVRFFTIAVISMGTAIAALWARILWLENILHDLLSK